MKHARILTVCERLRTGQTKSHVAHALLNAALSFRSSMLRFVKGVLAMTPERTHSDDEVLRRVQGEFLEMPGLRLTEPQARRLWGLDRDLCSALLRALVEANFLFRTRDGAFMRVEHPSPTRVTLPLTNKIAAA